MPLPRIAEVFDHPDWIFELKHDGFRALAHVDGHQCRPVSRRRHIYTQFPQLQLEIAHSARAHSAVRRMPPSTSSNLTSWAQNRAEVLAAESAD
jgi:hypothetical protein